MNIHIIKHERFEAPGTLNVWAKRNNHAVTHTNLYNGDALPQDIDAIDFLIVMGGPQSPATTVGECTYFDAPAETQLIKQAIESNTYVLGICLGAQLIGEALGAPFEHSPHKEIGVFEVSLTERARNDPVFSTFPPTFSVGHWHSDMPGLTENSQVLAKSEGCPRQIVKYTPRVYGFQCHFEFTPETLAEMVHFCSHELRQEGTYIQSAKEILEAECSSFNNLLFTFLDYIASMQNITQP